MCWGLSAPAVAARVTIIFWHTMAGELGVVLNQEVQAFNASQKKYEVKAFYKGDYIESLTSFSAAVQAKKPPDLIQVFEVGKGIMLQPKGIIFPAAALKAQLPVAQFFPALRAFYSVNDELMAMPFNVSVPVMFYNADALKAVGYDAAHFPKTWQALEKLAGVLHEKGFVCAYTSANPAWVLVDSFMALNGVSHEALLPHLERLRRWQQAGYFEYGGRVDNATVLFTSQHCALFSQSSGAFTTLMKMAPFKMGVAPMPIDTQWTKTRHANVVGGGALWAVANRSPAVYRGIARFYEFLALPSVQMRWHIKTGYLPLGLSGEYAAIATSSEQPILDIAKIDLALTQPEPSAELLPLNQLRTLDDQALEAVFSGLQTPAVALKELDMRRARVMRRFKENTLYTPRK